MFILCDVKGYRIDSEIFFECMVFWGVTDDDDGKQLFSKGNSID